MTERLHFHFSLSCIGEGNGNPLQCSCLENPRDGGARWAAISGVAQSWTRLKRLSSSSSSIDQFLLMCSKLFCLEINVSSCLLKMTQTFQIFVYFINILSTHNVWGNAAGAGEMMLHENRSLLLLYYFELLYNS